MQYFCFLGSEGLIEDVIMLGAPVSGDPKNWMAFSQIVAGKIVNGYSRLMTIYFVTGEKCRSWESNPGRLRDRPTLYHVAIKAGLYRKAVQVYHIPITTTYSSSTFRFIRESQFEQQLNTRPPSLVDHQAHQMGLFTLGARCNW